MRMGKTHEVTLGAYLSIAEALSLAQRWPSVNVC